MSETTSKIHPLIAIAAVAVIVFSAVGVGMMTGVIPSSKSANDGTPLTESKATAPEVKTAAAPEVKAAPAPAHKSVAPVARKSAPAEPKQQPTQVAVNERTAATPAASPVNRICTECGVIDVINVVEKKGSGSGIGAVGGAVVGGLLGNQVGGGSGKKVATVVGVVGGAVAGNEVERRVNSTNEYKVTVRMEDGTTRNFTFDSAPGYAVGEKVKIIDGRIVRS